MQRALLLLMLLAAVPTLRAQPADGAPMATVSAFFEAVRAADSSAVSATLHPHARLMTASVRDGRPVLSETAPPLFLSTVAGTAVGTLDERLYDVEVRIDGTMASVWAPYRFYLDGHFSHCGVNQFTLAKEGDGWQIVQIVDTRRREDCTME